MHGGVKATGVFESYDEAYHEIAHNRGIGADHKH